LSNRVSTHSPQEKGNFQSKQQPKKKHKSLPVEVSERQNKDEMTDDMAFNLPHVVGTEDLIHQTVSGDPTNDDKMLLVVNAISSILKNKTGRRQKTKQYYRQRR
jgi:hypothetical protein